MKFKQVLFGVLGAAFVLSIMLQSPIIAWAQNATKWYGSQGGANWTLASGGTITAQSGSTVTLGGTNNLSGTNTMSGPVAITGSSFAVSPVMAYTKCGQAVVVADSTTKTVACAGVVSTDVVVATVATDTSLYVLRAIPASPDAGSIKIVISDTVATGSTGVKVSWAVLRPQ